MMLISSKVFLLLIICLALMAAFPERIRNKHAYRRAVLSCVAVFAIYAGGIALLTLVGIPFLAFTNVKGPEDLLQLSWIGIFMAATWAAAGFGYWSAFRAAVDLAPLRAKKPAKHKTGPSSRTPRGKRSHTTVYRGEKGQVTKTVPQPE